MDKQRDTESLAEEILEELSRGGLCEYEQMPSDTVGDTEECFKAVGTCSITKRTAESAVQVSSSKCENEGQKKNLITVDNESPQNNVSAAVNDRHGDIVEEVVDGCEAGTGGGETVAETNIEKGKLHLCRLCGIVLDSSQDLLQHAQQHLSDRDEAFTCRVCAQMFPSASHLVQHLQAHPVLDLVTSAAGEQQGEGRRVACTECQEKFETSQLLYQHILTAHSAGEKLHCPVCAEKFGMKSQAEFVAHLNAHVVAPELQCNLCEKKFQTKLHLQGHMQTHKPRKKYLCATCGKCYSQKQYYDRHVKTHGEMGDKGNGGDTEEGLMPETEETEASQEAQYVCKICGKIQKTRGHLNMHMRCHVKYGPILQKLQCSTCNLTFTSKVERGKHMAQHKLQKAISQIPCSLCPQRFASHKLINAHTKKDHPDYRPFKCSKCDKTYKCDFDRYRHELTHDGKRAYQCPHCPRQLWNVGNLKQHILIQHLGIERKKDVACESCGRLFYHRHAMQNHVRHAHGKERFKCSFCPKSFKHKKSAEEHESVHTEEMPFECQQCHAKFRTRTTLRTHTFSVHGGSEKSWKCRDCEAAFSTKFGLSAHVRRVHWLCFQCLEHFPDRTTAVKHKCKLCRVDAYLQGEGQTDSQNSVVDKCESQNTGQSTCTIDSHDAFLEIVLAAGSLEKKKGSAPAAIEPENPSVSVAYTLTHGTSCPSVKFQRFKLRKPEEYRKPKKRSNVYAPLTPFVGKPIKESTECCVSTAVPLSERTSVLVKTKTGCPQSHGASLSAISQPGTSVVCDAFPITEDLFLTASSSGTSDDVSKSQGQAGPIACVPSPLKTPVTTDATVMQDHAYGNMLPLVLEVKEVSQSSLIDEISKIENPQAAEVEPLAAVPETGFTEHAYPSDRLQPGTDISLEDFFACLNETEGSTSIDGSKKTDSKNKRRVVNDVKGASSKSQLVTRKRAGSPKKHTSKKVRKTAGRAAHHAGLKMRTVCVCTDGGLYIEKNVMVQTKHASVTVEEDESNIPEGQMVYTLREDVVKIDNSDVVGTYRCENGVLIKLEPDSLVHAMNAEREEHLIKEEASVTDDVDDMFQDDSHEADDFDVDDGHLSEKEEQSPSELLKQPVKLKLMKMCSGISQPQGEVQNFAGRCSGPLPSPPPPQSTESRKVYCEICDRKYTCLETLRAHLRRVHYHDETFSCQHCTGYVTHSFSLLMMHFEQHAKQCNLPNGKSTPGSGDVLNTLQQVGPLWEASYSSKETGGSVFVALKTKSRSSTHKSNSRRGGEKP